MMRSILGAAIVAITTTAGLAGGVSEAEAERPPVIAPMSGNPFEGPYLGFEGFGRSAGTKYYTPPGLSTPFPLFPSDNTGVILGYNWASGPMVGGLEYRTQRFEDLNSATSNTPGISDLRFRAGPTIGDVFLYGAMGYSWGEINDRAPFGTSRLEGLNLGLGVEYAFWDHWFVGFDYTTRDLSGNAEDGRITDVDLQTSGFRLGYRF